ncbi:MAG: hypothetical protein DRH97_00240 [Chloroflexi bacterium]|nr:MAG: hypothetical protein DRH97_00240 [Chloroflexota bacterium]
MKMHKQLFYFSLIALVASVITGITDLNIMSVILVTGSMVIKGVREELKNQNNPDKRDSSLNCEFVIKEKPHTGGITSDKTGAPK